MFLYAIASIIFIYLILRAFIKIKFHFFFFLHVFTIYDLHHWLRPNRVIDKILPSVNQYVDISNIKTESIDKMSQGDIDCFCNFINKHYLRNKNAEYVPEKHHIIEYMKHANHPSYISINRHKYYNSERNNKDNDICSVITSRILHITLKSIGSFPIYYIDNLCVDPGMRKKKMAPKAIQTLHYHLRRKNKDVDTFLFKREGEMTAIVPLTTFDVQGYNANHISRMNLPHASMSTVEVSTKNLVLFVDLLKRQRELYDCIVVPELSNLSNMIKAEIISLHGILEGGKLIALYIFRDAATVYDGERSIELVISLSACHFHDIFYAGFTQALETCCKKWKASRVVIDSIGGNELITKKLKEREYSNFFTSKSAFFLYNYVSYTFPSNKCFLLC